MKGDYFLILWVIIVSTFSAFAKELNDKALDSSESLMLFVSEMLLNGVCGSLVGILLLNYTTSIYLVLFCSGVGGILGLRLIKIIVRICLMYYTAGKTIDWKEVFREDKDKKGGKV